MTAKSNKQLDLDLSDEFNNSQDNWTIKLQKVECDEMQCFTPYEEPFSDRELDIEILSNESKAVYQNIKLRKISLRPQQ